MKNVNTKLAVKIGLSIVVGLTGLLTIIFSILNLAGSKGVESSSILRIMVGILLIIIGSSTSLLTIFATPESKPFDLLSGGLFIGIGVYFFINHDVLNTIAILLFPLIVACFGGLMLIQSIFDTVKKTNNKSVFNMIVSICLLVIGILFAVFHKNQTLQSVVWLLLGIAIVILSIGEIVYTLKGKPKVKIVNNK